MIFVGVKIFSQDLPQQKEALVLLQVPVKPMPAMFLIIKTVATPVNTQPFLSANYYSTQLGFFCKQEIKFEKIAKISFKFRMGSVEDCDRLEGKRRSN